jgi:hypothetical protein
MKNRVLPCVLAAMATVLSLRLAGPNLQTQAQPASPSRQWIPRGQSPSTFPGNAVPGQFDSTGSQSIGDPEVRAFPIRHQRQDWWVTNKTTWWTNTDRMWWRGYRTELSNVPPAWWTNVPPTSWTNVPSSWWNSAPPHWWTNVPSDAWANVPPTWWTNAAIWTNRPPDHFRSDSAVNR